MPAAPASEGEWQTGVRRHGVNRVTRLAPRRSAPAAHTGQWCRHGAQAEPSPMHAQVGNYTLERAMWQRPEDMRNRRPVYYVATKNGAPAPSPDRVSWARGACAGCEACARRIGHGGGVLFCSCFCAAETVDPSLWRAACGVPPLGLAPHRTGTHTGGGPAAGRAVLSASRVPSVQPVKAACTRQRPPAPRRHVRPGRPDGGRARVDRAGV